MTTFDARHLPRIFGRIRQLVEAQKDRLTELDSIMGDGDLGVTMTKAFAAAEQEAAAAAEADVGRSLQKIGMAISRAAPSTMGTLIATGFLRGAKELAGLQTVGTPELGAFFAAFVKGIMDRGKAALGEKTILDALSPAAEALLANRQQPVSEALRHAAAAARAGVEATREMQPAHGKGFYHQEAAKGVEDPGALTGFLVIEGLLEALAEEQPDS